MENRFECNGCNKRFDTELALNQHNAAKHNSLKGLSSKSKVRTKSVFKYGLIALIVIIVAGAAYHHFSSSTGSVNKVSSFSGALLGTKAPDFTLQSTTGGKISLSDYYGKKNVLLFFQEGVMCDPCWEQIVDIEKEYDKFASKDIELVSITVDPLNALVKNAKRFGITTPILADEDLKVSSAYDVLKDAMHPGSRPGHTFVFVNKNGDIVWKKAYFLASGSTKMTMRMQDGSVMDMDMGMGMDMGKPGSVMYVSVDRLLADMSNVKLESGGADSEMNMSDSNMTMQDHSMCLTPIHMHADFKMYLNGAMLNFSQNNYMDQSNIVHFHKTVKVKPDDTPNIPNGDIIHIHKEGITVREFLKTLDLAFDVGSMQDLKVHVNGDQNTKGLDYTMLEKDRILVTDSTDDAQIKQQTDSVTDYALQGKEKNSSLFGGC